MPTRRALLLGTGAAILVSRPVFAAAQNIVEAPMTPRRPASNEIAFDIFRKGSKIGHHRLSFQGGEQDFQVAIDVEMVVKIGFIPVFRYEHQNLERWEQGRFVGLEAKTNNDGDDLVTKVTQTEKGYRVESTGKKTYVAPSQALAATHWNIDELNGPMINPQNGELLTPEVVKLGADKVPLADGEHVPATGYKLEMKDPLSLWYDGQEQWTALDFTAGDGSSVVYRKV